MSAPIEGSFGQLLRRYRLAAGYSQEGLAAAAGLGAHTIADLERGVTHYPHPHTVQALADALHFTDTTRAAFESAGRRRSISLFAEAPTGGDTSPHIPLFVGRAHERALYERLLAGEGPPLLLYSGEPGIGKSRMLAEAATHAHAAGWRVLVGGCDQRSGREPYAPFVELLAAAALATPRARRASDLKECRWLARLVPEIAELAPAPVSEWARDPGQERRLMFSAVKRYLDNIAGPAGTLLLLDDLQWADPDALDLLAFLAQTTARRWTATEPPDARLSIAGAYRSSEVPNGHPLDDLLLQLAQQEGVSLCSLDRFTAEEARLLLSRLVAAKPETAVAETDGWADEIIARAEGVPFYLVTFALDARPASSVGDALKRAAAVERRAGQGGIPWLVTAQIRQRVSALPPEAQEALAVAALIGRVAPLTLLCATLTSPEDTVVYALEAACRAHLLEETSGATVAYQFTHDLIRETIMNRLSKARMMLLHRRIGAALELALAQAPAAERARQVAALAHHLVQARELARALPYLLEAGDRAEAVSAHAEAEAFYRRARDLAAELADQAHEAAVLVKLSSVLATEGRKSEALDPAERALAIYHALGDPVGELRALAASILAQAEFGPAVLDAAAAQANAVLARLEPSDARMLTPALAAALADVYYSLGWLHFGVGHYHEQLDVSRRAVELGQVAEDERQVVRAEALLNLAEGFLGAPMDRALLEDLLARAERTGQLDISAHTYNNLAETYEYAGDFVQMLVAQEQAIVLSERRQNPLLLADNLLNLAERCFYLGDWRRAHEVDARFLAIVHEVDPRGETWISRRKPLISGLLALAEGREQDGRRLLEQVIGKTEEVSLTFVLAMAVRALAEADLLAGQAHHARQRLADFLQHPAVIGHAARMALPYLAWAEGALGQYGAAEDALGPAVTAAEALLRVDGLRVQGWLALTQERCAVGAEALDEALTLCRAMPYPYAEAKALWVYGQLEAARGDPVAARECFVQALAICDRLGEGLYRTRIACEVSALAHT